MQILIVDDSKAMRMIVSRTLRQAGCDEDFLQAANGVEALEVISKTPPDLIFCDWNMPQMNGIDLLKELRSQGNSVEFVFVTSEGTEEIRELALGAGASKVITKPFTPEDFQQALESVTV